MTDPPLVRIAVPAGDVAPIASMLGELFADLELPPRFAVVEGDAQIEDFPLLPRDGARICDVVFDHRVQLITEGLARHVGLSAPLLRDLVRFGLRTSRATQSRADQPADDAGRLEAALDDVGGRFALRVERGTHDALVASTSEGKGWSDLLAMMSAGLFYELGLTLGSCDLIVDDRVPVNGWQVQINDLRLPAMMGLARDERLVNDTPDRLQLLGVNGRPARNPANGVACAIIDAGAAGVCEAAGLTTWTPAGFAILSLSAAIRRHAGALLSRLVVDHTMKNLGRAFPDLIDRANQLSSLDDTTRVLRGLLCEEVAIRNLRLILEAMIALGPPPEVDLAKLIVFTLPGNDTIRPRGGSPIASIVDGVRSALKRQISHKHTQGGSTLVVYLLDPEIQRGITACEVAPAFIAAVRRAMAKQRASRARFPTPPVLLTTADVRARCAALFEGDFPRQAVVAYTELSPDLNIQPLARISLD
jgi:type III secretory pathway component EscV